MAGAGPAQSDALTHFTGRPFDRPNTPKVPEEIRELKPEERLARILLSEELLAFPAFGATVPTVSFSESPQKHLEHLIGERGFPPWGIAVSREGLLATGGGAVAYLPEDVRDTFPESLRHWVVPIKTDGSRGDWSHEREWRRPQSSGSVGFAAEFVAKAILIGDPEWRPIRTGTSTGPPWRAAGR
ncbi:hypothetical protein VM98_30755 [Streptomyces rubellomurinus subsp. indigoferus]|nr:hypothetical protein VM98_30755 [Streptomyces rubellomurinus subsp. indigoferus]